MFWGFFEPIYLERHYQTPLGTIQKHTPRPYSAPIWLVLCWWPHCSDQIWRSTLCVCWHQADFEGMRIQPTKISLQHLDTSAEDGCYWFSRGMHPQSCGRITCRIHTGNHSASWTTRSQDPRSTLEPTNKSLNFQCVWCRSSSSNYGTNKEECDQCYWEILWSIRISLSGGAEIQTAVPETVYEQNGLGSTIDRFLTGWVELSGAGPTSECPGVDPEMLPWRYWQYLSTLPYSVQFLRCLNESVHAGCSLSDAQDSQHHQSSIRCLQDQSFPNAGVNNPRIGRGVGSNLIVIRPCVWSCRRVINDRIFPLLWMNKKNNSLLY